MSITTTLPPEPPTPGAKPKPTEASLKVEGPQPWAGVLTAARIQLEKEKEVRNVHQRKPKQKVLPSKFGVSAFAETICRVAFTYLATYGNNPQMSTGGYVRGVWLFSYLKCVFSNLNQSLQKRVAGGAFLPGKGSLEEKKGRRGGGEPPSPRSPRGFSKAGNFVHEALRKALRDIPKKLWESPPQQLTDLLPSTRLVAGLPEAASSDALQIQKRRRSLHADEIVDPSRRASKETDTSRDHSKEPVNVSKRNSGAQVSKRKSSNAPARRHSQLGDDLGELTEITGGKEKHAPRIENGVCTLCERRVKDGEWGSARCHGCAIVDQLPFERHLFKSLLVHKPRQNLKGWVAETPLQTRKHVLTPPPMGRSHSLRKAPDRKKTTFSPDFSSEELE